MGKFVPHTLSCRHTLHPSARSTGSGGHSSRRGAPGATSEVSTNSSSTRASVWRTRSAQCRCTPPPGTTSKGDTHSSSFDIRQPCASPTAGAKVHHTAPGQRAAGRSNQRRSNSIDDGSSSVRRRVSSARTGSATGALSGASTRRTAVSSPSCSTRSVSVGDHQRDIASECSSPGLVLSHRAHHSSSGSVAPL